MFVRIEVAVKPEFADPAAQAMLRRIEVALPEVRARVRWARLLDIYWLDLPLPREDAIPAITEVFHDRVLQYVFTGNLIPSLAGKHGGALDLLESSPVRPGVFWALERRLRPGVTDNVGRTALEAFRIVTGKELPDAGPGAARAASGSLLVLEGDGITDGDRERIAREVFCNELIETWTSYPESDLRKNDRFHPERVKLDLPHSRVPTAATGAVGAVVLEDLGDAELEALSQRQLWALSLAEMRAVRDHYRQPEVRADRAGRGLPESPTDVEIEVIAQTWSEHCKHKIFAARWTYEDASGEEPTAEIPARGESLFKTTITRTTEELARPWLLSVFHDNAGVVAFDDEDAVCIKVETHNSPSALDPFGGALTGIVGVNRDILGCGMGARPIFNTDVFCVAPLDTPGPMPERILPPRRILDGIRRGVEAGGNQSGIPTVNGALVFDPRYLGKPLVYCGTGGILPRQVAGRPGEEKRVLPGDRVVMVGGRIGKDGIHGATFSSLAMDRNSPASAVQLGDPITQKRAADFLLEARDRGLYRAITDNGAGGLSSSVGEMARLSGGATIDVAQARTKYPGLKPYELTVSESQERMTLAVAPEKLADFERLARARGVETSDLGEFTTDGRFEVRYRGAVVASLELAFLHDGCPKLDLPARWEGRGEAPRPKQARAFADEGANALLELLRRPNIASKEWLIRQYDHEVQGTSVVKPLHLAQPGTDAAESGPNDGAVLQPKLGVDRGLAVACGLAPRYSDLDPHLMAQLSVDEAVRNLLCVGAAYGTPDAVLALVDNFCWPDPTQDPRKMAALVRACFGLREAALALGAPLISGKDSMKNDYRGPDRTISVPPTLLVTAMGLVLGVGRARTADFKAAGDSLYLVGGGRLGLWRSELHEWLGDVPEETGAPAPHWEQARRIYGWLGGASGREQARLRSIHDVSDGGLLVAVAESCLARGWGAEIELGADAHGAGGTPARPWTAAFGEGFHTFVVSCAEADGAAVEAEWERENVPFRRLGSVTTRGKLEVQVGGRTVFGVKTGTLRAAWRREGYWE